ncbi:hypothetical protein PARU111607_06360 [Palleronia rufa]
MQPTDGSGARLTGDRASPWMIGLPVISDQLMASYAECGEIIAYAEEKPAQWGHAGFNLVLMDFERLKTVRAALSPDPDPVDAFEIEV